MPTDRAIQYFINSVNERYRYVYRYVIEPSEEMMRLVATELARMDSCRARTCWQRLLEDDEL